MAASAEGMVLSDFAAEENVRNGPTRDLTELWTVLFLLIILNVNVGSELRYRQDN